MPPLAKHLAGRPARDPRARPEPRLHPQRGVHDAHRRRLVPRPGDPLRRDKATKVGVVEPAPAGLSTAIESTAQRFDQEVAIRTYPDAAAADAALADGKVEVVVAMPADLSGPGDIRFDKRPDQATAQIVSAAMIGLRVQRSSARATSTWVPWLPRSSRQRSMLASRRPRTTRRGSSSPTSAPS